VASLTVFQGERGERGLNEWKRAYGPAKNLCFVLKRVDGGVEGAKNSVVEELACGSFDFDLRSEDMCWYGSVGRVRLVSRYEMVPSE
jgi:hypothetical protein